MATRSELTFFWRFIEVVVIFFVKVVMRWRVDIRGTEHLPRSSGAVVAFNHHSYFDFVMVAWAAVRSLRRPVRFLAKREMWKSRKTLWLVRAADAVPVDRDSTSSRHRAFDEAIARLRSGELVAVAPEQTISQSFQLLPFRTGAVRMAQAAGVPIVPAIGWGTHRFATKGRSPAMARHIAVTVRYGEPVHVAADEDPVAATRRLQDVMERMLAEVQNAYPDLPEPGDDWWMPAALGGGAPPHGEVVAQHERRAGRRDSHAASASAAEPSSAPPPSSAEETSPPAEAAGG